ncbi:hypothetical protein E2C01_024274 [Portunus trituberculatus]|uniref:Uncharacterized protein n=1 Tax=Portunus trituberculatus TaxID=210409 RepID=A0A5B7EA70_PORTR|nr:hypothetical protein [Portunus trituberculatus]
MRIKKVGGNRKGDMSVASDSCVSKLMKKNLREVSRHSGSQSGKQSDLGTFLVPSPEGDFEAGFGIAILNFERASCDCPLDL